MSFASKPEAGLHCDVAVVGGGPAGLRAAEVAARGGARVIVFEQKPSVGRKFLVAGKGGLNLTHEASVDEFARHYTVSGMEEDNAMALWRILLRGFDSNALRLWAGSLGIETFCASSGRVYPKEMKSAPLLRRWVERLRGLGVEFRTRQRWTGLRSEMPLELEFSGASDEAPDCAVRVVRAGAAVLALGGASWPQTGSTGIWTNTLAE
ncbi:MAG: NAD(P)/FAD-dependent oxidoreductase, partial [Chthoniobacteraceae bacterium]|nr:NAD(P)/FAD-dependent oxidoreductase [Chthoniobacteraceae bacterium]